MSEIWPALQRAPDSIQLGGLNAACAGSSASRAPSASFVVGGEASSTSRAASPSCFATLLDLHRLSHDQHSSTIPLLFMAKALRKCPPGSQERMATTPPRLMKPHNASQRALRNSIAPLSQLPPTLYQVLWAFINPNPCPGQHSYQESLEN